jgi:glyoxylase-like metal-dependent hydrolase (beta-lactamase superfamily II)
MKYTTMLPLPADLGGFKTFFNAAAVRGDDGLVLVDVGFPGFLKTLEETMASAGLKLSDVKKVIITHCDGDHAGGLKAFADKYPGVEIISSGKQAAYLTGKEKHPRMVAAEQRYAASTDQEEKKAMTEEIGRLKAQETVQKVTAVGDGAVLKGCGVQIIEISGHLPGHVCVYVPGDKALITGDALTAFEGKLNPPDKNFTLDMTTALKSLEKLLDYDIENVICYHGGLVTGNIRERILEIVDK